MNLLQTTLVVLSIVQLPAVLALPSPSFQWSFHGPEASTKSDDVSVPVTLGVMSRCPDALFCESVFDRVLASVGHTKLDLKLEFIATYVVILPLPRLPSTAELPFILIFRLLFPPQSPILTRSLAIRCRPNATDTEYGVTCKHGAIECEGNVHQLCAIAHTPSSPSSSQYWWPFVSCVDYAGKETIGHLDRAKKCAKVAGIDWERSGVAQCVDGEEGKVLLRESAARARRRGIQKSCTILINDQVVCIRDDASWKSCLDGHETADFVRLINEEYDRLNPDRP